MPFTIRKTSRFVPIDSPFVTAVHGNAWMKELREMCGRVEQKLPSGKELERVPGTRNEPAKEKLHEGDLYLSTESLQAFEGALGGVFDGVDAVFQTNQNLDGPRQSFICIRPPGHHCSASHPSGFCWINNVHIGINYAAQTYGLTHAAIIDFDLHHGDGSQSITWAHNENMAQPTKSKKASPQKYSIGYFSLHDINSYPCEYGDREKVQNASLCIENAHGQSIWNVHLQKWTTEAEFWQLYQKKYIILLEKARSFLRSHTRKLQQDPNQPEPKAAIFLSAGFDASEHEHKMMQRHDVCVPTEFYARFTRDVITLAQEEGTGVEGRIISVLEGGYSDKALMSGVLSHISGLCDGDLTKIKQESENDSRLGMEMMSLAISTENSDKVDIRHVTYDPEWWHPDHLMTLEQLLNPTPAAGPKPLGRKPRTGAYSSPTASSTAKIVESSKVHRSVSASSRFTSANPSRASSPPLPEVDWIVATHELCKLLIPKDRPTRSFTSVELSESVAKKERRTTHEAPSNAASSDRQLRDRGKSRALNQTNNKTLALRTVSEADRRKTISDLPVMASDDNHDELPRPAQPRRRSSTASTISTVSATPSVGGTARASGPAVKLSSNGIQVKKTRNTNGVSTSQTTAKPPPVPRIPSNYSTQSKQPAQGPKRASESREGSAEASNFDQLASGFQRLKINVPSKEEYAARQQKKAADESAKRAALSKSTAKSNSGKTTKTTTAVKKAPSKDVKAKAVATNTPTTMPSVEVQHGALPTSHELEVGGLASMTAGTEQPLRLPSPPAAPSIQFQNSVPAIAGFSSASHDFGNAQLPPESTDIPEVGQECHSQQDKPIVSLYQPSLLAPAGVIGDNGQPFYQPQAMVFHHEYPMNDHVTANGHQQQDQQLQWQTPNKDLVSPTLGLKKTRSSPPKFSATGPIPFASAPTQS
jgi:histone deacetylase HOS3